MGCPAEPWPAEQDEFQFYLEDAKSKLVLVPAAGNPKAEAAAKAFSVPVASLSVHLGSGEPLPVLSDTQALHGLSCAMSH